MKSTCLVGKKTNVCMFRGGGVVKLWLLGFYYICLSRVPPLSCRVHYIYTHSQTNLFTSSYSPTLSWNVWDVCELEIVGNWAGTWLLICKCDPTWERHRDKETGREKKRERYQCQYKREKKRKRNEAVREYKAFSPLVQWKTVQCLSGFTSE